MEDTRAIRETVRNLAKFMKANKISVAELDQNEDQEPEIKLSFNQDDHEEVYGLDGEWRGSRYFGCVTGD